MGQRGPQESPGGEIAAATPVYVRPCEARILVALLESQGGTLRVVARYAGLRSVPRVNSMVKAFERAGLAAQVPLRVGERGRPRHIATPTDLAWAWAEGVARGEIPDLWGFGRELRAAVRARPNRPSGRRRRRAA